MTDRDDPLDLLGRLTDRPFPVREIPSEPAHANEHANEHVVSKLEIPAAAVQAAVDAVNAHEWGPHPHSAHADHINDSGCAVCRRDVPAIVAVALAAVAPMPPGEPSAAPYGPETAGDRTMDQPDDSRASTALSGGHPVERVEDLAAPPEHREYAAQLCTALCRDVEQDRDELLSLVRDLVDPDPCWYDHDGGCQQHGWYKEPRCPHARAQHFLADPATSTGDTHA